MRIRWLSIAERDISRLYDFLAEVSLNAAATRIQNIVASVTTLSDHPRIGVRRDEYGTDEVRSLLIGDYEVRYQIFDDEIVILRIWHTREDR
jgi:plasmid stabilization system protein ParE